MNKSEECGTRGGVKPQIAKYIFRKHVKAMKDMLDAGEWKYEGKRSPGFKHYRKLVQNTFYTELGQIFEFLEKCCIIQDCGCGANLERREGWKPCVRCNGCGYKNTPFINDMFSMLEGWNPDPEKMIQPYIDELVKERVKQFQEQETKFEEDGELVETDH